MKDFDADFFQVMKIEPQNEIIFYDEITLLPNKIQGAFIVDELIKAKLKLKITDQEGNIILTYVGTKLVFENEISKSGVYQISIKNMTKQNTCFVTFTYSSNKTKILSRNDIDKPKKLINETKKILDNFALLLKFKSGSNKERYKSKSYIYIFLQKYKPQINISLRFV